MRRFLACVLLLAVTLLASPALFAESPTAPSLAGRWEGRYIDLTGFDCPLVLDLREDLTGTYTLTIPDEESVSTVRGTIAGARSGDALTFALGDLRYRAALRDASPHALQALYGSAEPVPTSRAFKGGVFMLWRSAP